MRVKSYQLFFLDHFLIAMALLHTRDFPKQHLTSFPLVTAPSLYWLRQSSLRSALIVCSIKILAQLLDRFVFGIFVVQKSRAHTDLFPKFIQMLMQNGLKGNNCKPKHVTTAIDDISCDRVDKILPASNTYACDYWVQHFQDSDYRSETLAIREKRHRLISKFLYKHLLHWVEAMSPLRKISKAISSLSSLESSIVSSRKELYNLVHDAKRFLLACRSLIESYPLQVYSSALLFSPENIFQDTAPDWITSQPTMDSNQSPRLQTLHHEGYI
ncbi:hypothetical protein F5B21DRAFT_321452 [Xylaria acuta]|nr:hypothetical protein F5B21DRAFT_321452 [Xylaria acuta]